MVMIKTTVDGVFYSEEVEPRLLRIVIMTAPAPPGTFPPTRAML